ncbi:MAG: hypothetical protein EB069_03110 [Actinobacteria bacterium]|nr:hypothetical protein [Actinomycetota bacterium]
MSNKLTAEQRIQKAHVSLMKHPKYCLYSGVFMIGKIEVNDMPTAATNGRDVFYGRKFVQDLDEREVKAVVLHENIHKALRQLSVWQHLFKKSADIANIAADYVTNLLIEDSDPSGVDVRLPDDALLDTDFRGLDTGEIFRRLMDDADKRGKIRIKTKGDPNGKDIPVGSLPDGLDEHQFGDAESMGKEEREKLAREIDQALRQGAILAGKMSANVPREISEALKATVDWREALRDYITSYCQERDISTWRRPSRRWIAQDVYMPSMIGESIGRVVLALDMSGSIDNVVIGKFLGEVQRVCETVRPDGIDLLYWDTKVCQHEKYEHDQLDSLISTTKPRGGGGTSPACIPKYIRDKKIKVECAIVLTDGYVDGWGGQWPCPVLWGITTQNISASVGKSVYIKD